MHSFSAFCFSISALYFKPVHVHGRLARSDSAIRSLPLRWSEAWGRDKMVSELLSCSMGLHEPPRHSNRGYIPFFPAKVWMWKTVKNSNWEIFVNSRKIGRSSLSAIADGLTKSPSAVAEGLMKFTICRFGRQSDPTADRKELRSPTR